MLYYYLPTAFREYLIENDVAFRNLDEKDQRGIAWMLFSAFSGHKEHKSGFPGGFPVHWQTKRRLFGKRTTFEALNAALDYFFLTETHLTGSHARGYVLTRKALSLCEGYLQQPTFGRVGLEDRRGMPLRLVKSPIRAVTKQGLKTRFSNSGSLTSRVHIDRKALLSFIDAVGAWLIGEAAVRSFEYVHDVYEELARVEGVDRARLRADRGIVQARLLLDLASRTSKAGDYIPAYYQELRSGRLYALGTTNIQVCMREVRRAALRNCIDYDVNNAHCVLLSCICRAIGVWTPQLDAYISDKEGFRTRLAEETGLTISEVKKILIQVIYGATLVANPTRPGSVEKLIGYWAMERLVANETIRSLKRELAGVGSEAIKHYRRESAHRGRFALINDARRELDLRKKERSCSNRRSGCATQGTSPENCTQDEPKLIPAGKQLAHILQGAESEVLRACMSFVPDLVMIAHDGFVCRHSIDLQGLERRVEEQTGFTVTFAENSL